MAVTPMDWRDTLFAFPSSGSCWRYGPNNPGLTLNMYDKPQLYVEYYILGHRALSADKTDAKTNCSILLTRNAVGGERENTIIPSRRMHVCCTRTSRAQARFSTAQLREKARRKHLPFFPCRVTAPMRSPVTAQNCRVYKSPTYIFHEESV